MNTLLICTPLMKQMHTTDTEIASYHSKKGVTSSNNPACVSTHLGYRRLLLSIINASYICQ